MAAHEGAMKTGRTVAILGEGLEAVMSYEKRKFLERVIENGAVITEYSPNTPATKGTFPQRRRLTRGRNHDSLRCSSAMVDLIKYKQSLRLPRRRECPRASR